jgi:hypothetical protein
MRLSAYGTASWSSAGRAGLLHMPRIGNRTLLRNTNSQIKIFLRMTSAANSTTQRPMPPDKHDPKLCGNHQYVPRGRPFWHKTYTCLFWTTSGLPALKTVPELTESPCVGQVHFFTTLASLNVKEELTKQSKLRTTRLNCGTLDVLA